MGKEIALSAGASQSILSRELRRNETGSEKYLLNKARGMAMAHHGERSQGQCSRVGGAGAYEVGQIVAEAGRGEYEEGRQAYVARTDMPLRRADGSGKPVGHCRHGMKYGRHGRSDCTAKAGNILGRTGIHNKPEEADGRRSGN